MGFFTPGEEEPIGFEGIAVYFRVAKGRNNYPSVLRNGIRSRKIAQYDGHSLKYENAEFLKKFGTSKEI